MMDGMERNALFEDSHLKTECERHNVHNLVMNANMEINRQMKT